MFTDFNLTRLQDAETISPTQVDFGDLLPYVAAEVRQGGLAAADARSDIAALCASLLTLFEPGEPLADQVRGILELGCAPNPTDRPTLDDLAQALADLTPVDAPAAPPSLPPAEYWDEDTVVDFQQSRYKIVGRSVGKGGIGLTFKVVELDAHSDEKFGTYVAKLVRDAADGEAAILAYKRVRAYTTNHPNLSTILAFAPVWEPDRFVALLKWVEGQPLHDLTGVLDLYAADLGEASAEALAHRWLLDLCAALGELHRVGLVHGDVSPKNLIVQGGTLVLTDYDTAAPAGEAARGGTFLYTSPAVQARQAIQPADDLYALAASLFHCLTDREPFAYGTEWRKDLGLNWDGIKGYASLRPFLDRATHPDPTQRFADALAARGFLADQVQEADPDTDHQAIKTDPPALTPNAVPWLRQLLSSYPGSRHGNSETRGLDSPFAEATYVETPLDDILLAEIEAGSINLIILFGNAGDGKTAFLQHLAQRLGLPDIHSSQRVWEKQISGGRQLKVNLDGAAAWEGQSANAMLDDLFQPFHDPAFSRGRVHIVAVNNGKLLEWIQTQPQDTWLTEPLRRVLLGEDAAMEEPRFRLIDLNRRSLVGGIDQGRLTTDFLDTLIDRLLGGDTNHWEPCTTCTAQGRCTAWHSAQSLRDPDQGPRLRQRLTDLLQACHQRGEIHITARELRAALSYCLFGVHECAELHADPDLRQTHYWQRAFDAQSTQRQGELLAETARFDPALEADPILDRRLLRGPGPDRSGDHLAQARRRAWFIRPVGAEDGDITLANGRYLARFRGLPLTSPQEAAAVLRDLCLGIARLEDLPALAFAPGQLGLGVPLRITPRTPTESAFWVVKPWERFDLKPALPSAAVGLETLHTHLHLIYRYANGGQEVLTLGLELFHLLLDLKDGVQISGVAQEGVFANLEIFTQRLAREDARTLHGWHPTEEERVFQVRIEPREGRQVLVREAL